MKQGDLKKTKKRTKWSRILFFTAFFVWLCTLVCVAIVFGVVFSHDDDNDSKDRDSNYY